MLQRERKILCQVSSVYVDPTGVVVGSWRAAVFVTQDQPFRL